MPITHRSTQLPAPTSDAGSGSHGIAHGFALRKDDPADHRSNSVVFTQRDGHTIATMTVTYASAEARAAAAASPMAEGMEIGFKRLDAVLAEEQHS